MWRQYSDSRSNCRNVAPDQLRTVCSFCVCIAETTKGVRQEWSLVSETRYFCSDWTNHTGDVRVCVGVWRLISDPLCSNRGWRFALTDRPQCRIGTAPPTSEAELSGWARAADRAIITSVEGEMIRLCEMRTRMQQLLACAPASFRLGWKFTCKQRMPFWSCH